MSRLLVVGLFFSLAVGSIAQTSVRVANKSLPAGYWPRGQSQPIIDKTQTIRLSAGHFSSD